jgi:hypothetical protein
MRPLNLQLIRRTAAYFSSGGRLLTIIFVALSAQVIGQIGGAYSIERSTIVSGGGSASGGVFEVQGTIAQPFAGGPSSLSPYLLYSGFWTPQISPTAAPITIAGRVKTSADRGIRGAIVTLTSGNGHLISVTTSSFGYYRFQSLTAGETYILTVSAPRYVFSNASAVVAAEDSVADLDFVADN